MSRRVAIAVRWGAGAWCAAVHAVAAAAPWTAETPVPRGLAGHAAAVHEGRLIVAGGSYWSGETKRIENAVHRRALRGADAGRWETLTPLPAGFAHSASAVGAGALWLAGGTTDAIQRLDLATGAARQIGALPERRTYAGAAFAAGAVWIVGGTPTDTDFSAARATMLRIDAGTGTVTPAPAGPAWINPVVLTLGDELHVLPGSLWSAERRRLEAPRETWIFSLSARQWTQRPLAADLPRGLSGVALDRHRAVLVGGVRPDQTGADGGPAPISREVWLYDGRTGALQPQPPLPAPRLAAALAGAAGDVWLSGGEDRARGRTDTVWRWTPPAEGTP